jgi:hypothetical protein
MQVNPVTGNYQFACPYCGSFLSIQRYIDLLSDDVRCKRCQQIVNVPSLISLETDSKPYHPGQLRREVRLLPNGKNSVRLVQKTTYEQLNLFGGML